jgi:hypothetical protein
MQIGTARLNAYACLSNDFNDSAGDMRGPNDFKTQLASRCAIFIPVTCDML